jgi:hypothetical protein
MKKGLIVAVAVLAGFGLASIAVAQAAPQGQKQAQVTPTPRGWNYQLDAKGNRIPKGNRTTNADGSWREEIGQGKCKTIKEMSAKGEYKETHSCG